jgi:DNA-binding SARP family transcriptional activator/tetratricopeptide (TPR) repeat protein
MWFGVLGPLLVCDGDEVVHVPGARQRVLLAALLLRANKVVAADTLAELIWDGTPPAGAGITLRSHVSRLRQVLGPDAGARLVTRYPGYQIEATDEEVDLLRFARLCREGASSVRAGAWAKASDVLDNALALWRGEPLADIRCDLLHHDETPALVQLRLQAVEWQIEARLHLGHHGELVAQLLPLTAAHPLQERFYAQLMLAHYQCGRQAEALATYQQARHVLADVVGADPGAELRELHQRILAGDSSLDAPRPTSPVSASTAPAVPRQLPAPVAHFVGRTDELATLTRLLDRPSGQAAGPGGDQAPEAVLISAIGGTAGVGKTALAVHWAHRAADRFPDGQLYRNLRGYDPAQPVLATDALAGFLHALGVPAHLVPAAESDRAAQYRSLLAGRRMLVMLDNANDVEQIRPLLPGSPGCMVVVTSRDALAGLVARDGARRLDLDLLPRDDALLLLRATIGARVDADPDAAEALAIRCCRLPLALRVAAELAVARPVVTLAELASELADQQRRLDLLDAAGDQRTAVRAVFSWSYRHLADDAARAFWLLGLHPGADLDSWAAAALIATPVADARRLLDRLARANLIQLVPPDRYSMHDLLRAYARQVAADEATDAARRAALTRLLDHYLHAAAAAMGTLYPGERRDHGQVPRYQGEAIGAGAATGQVTEPGAARRWLDAERANLATITAFAADHGWPGHATSLAATLFRYLDTGSHYSEAVTIHAHARKAAVSVGDRAAEATALNGLGLAGWRQGRHQQATDQLEAALCLCRQTGDRTGETRALVNLGVIDSRQGRHGQAADHFESALVLCRQTGDRTGETRALVNLGLAELRSGRHEQATAHLDAALELCQQTGDRTAGGYALTGLGVLDVRQGRYQQATGHHQEALELFREVGDRSGEANTLNGLGELFLARDRPGDARTHHTMALQAAREIGDAYEEARAHDGLARACRTIGDEAEAARSWQRALTIYTQLGTPEADQVREHLVGGQ